MDAPKTFTPPWIKAARKAAEKQRGTAQERGYTKRWHRARTEYLRQHPLCVRCLAEGLSVAATVVDHIVPHRGDEELFWDESNWQSLCVTHHAEKTANEDGGFGRARK